MRNFETKSNFIQSRFKAWVHIQRKFKVLNGFFIIPQIFILKRNQGINLILFIGLLQCMLKFLNSFIVQLHFAVDGSFRHKKIHTGRIQKLRIFQHFQSFFCFALIQNKLSLADNKTDIKRILGHRHGNGLTGFANIVALHIIIDNLLEIFRIEEIMPFEVQHSFETFDQRLYLGIVPRVKFNTHFTEISPQS